jgi:transposase
MKANYFIGIDVSKSKLDVAVLNDQGQVLLEFQIKNTPAGINTQLSKLKKKYGINRDNTILCCEHTGIYNRPLEIASQKANLTLWEENPVKIKRSTPELRGKSDRDDALRIARYSLRFQDQLVAYVEPPESQNKLAMLMQARESLLNQLTALQQILNEAASHNTERKALLKKFYNKPITSLKKEIKNIEKEISESLNDNPDLKRNVDLITTIPGIGLQTAVSLVIVTKNFTLFENAKKMACYAGVAPFPNTSGTSVRGKNKVSSFANKKIKKLLHMAAMAARRANGDLKEYFIRKVKEGKNKMSIINAIRNKLLHRVFAVIRRQSGYVKSIISSREEIAEIA